MKEGGDSQRGKMVGSSGIVPIVGLQEMVPDCQIARQNMHGCITVHRMTIDTWYSKRPMLVTH